MKRHAVPDQFHTGAKAPQEPAGEKGHPGPAAGRGSPAGPRVPEQEGRRAPAGGLRILPEFSEGGPSLQELFTEVLKREKAGLPVVPGPSGTGGGTGGGDGGQS